MERVRKHLAGVTARLVLDLAELIGRAGHHLPRLSGRVVVHDGCETAGGVGQRHARLVSRIEEERVRVVRIAGRGGIELEWIGRTQRLATEREEGAVDVLDLAEDMTLARGVEGGAVDRIL